MRTALATVTKKQAEIRQRRQRSHSLSTVAPKQSSDEFVPELAAVAASILYRSPHPSQSGLPVFILNAAALPDIYEVDYDGLLPYVLSRLPGEDELLAGQEYEVVFFAGGQPESPTTEKKQGPGIGWYLQAYHVLSRALRKKLQRLYIVHPRTWVRVLIGVFGTIVSPKFRRKIVMVNTLTSLALHIPIEKLLIPPTVYLHDRRLTPDIFAPYASGRRAFGAQHPLPRNIESGQSRLPRVLRETTSFILQPVNLNTEGIFRIPPNSVLAGVLKEAYDRGQEWIIWHERGQTVVQPGLQGSLLAEIRPEDTYGVHLAASLIKSWYRELRQPIFPEASYSWLRELYGDADKTIVVESLSSLLLPGSDSSPLPVSGREIVTRHLLPLLHAVAEHEAQNKMSPEALGVCFAMTLVCGPNQLEDAKMTSILKRVLAAAIQAWPQLRSQMGVAASAFRQELNPPSSLKDYEDPLEEARAQPSSHESHPLVKEQPGNDNRRILLEDNESDDNTQPPPLPQRNRATSSPSRPSPPGSTLVSVPKRKPAPPILEPPRYSTIFDQDGISIHEADSPVSYVPADGFGPPRRGDWSIDGDHKKVVPPSPIDTSNEPPPIDMPKRKPISGPCSSTSSPREVSGSSTTGSFVAAQQVAQDMSQRLAKIRVSNGDSIKENEPTSASSDGAATRKPSWPTPTMRQASQGAPAVPMLPPRNTFPQVSTGSNSYMTVPPGIPRPRAPSPGLLKRMTAMEEQVNEAQSQSLPAERQPRPLRLKQASVDDLRRLYEERASTARELNKVAGNKRAPTH